MNFKQKFVFLFTNVKKNCIIKLQITMMNDVAPRGCVGLVSNPVVHLIYINLLTF